MLSVGGLTPSIAAAATTTAVASTPKDAAPLSTGFATFVAVAVVVVVVVVVVVGGGGGSGDGDDGGAGSPGASTLAGAASIDEIDVTGKPAAALSS